MDMSLGDVNASHSGMVALLTEEWNAQMARRWMADTFGANAPKVVLVYLLSIYLGQKWMRNRAAMKLDGTLAAWNLAFCVFSGVCAAKMYPDFRAALTDFGLAGSYCDLGTFYTDQATGYWGYLYCLSKVVEFGDTLWLVLRKRPVIFLHWYHHAATFSFCAMIYWYTQAFARWAVFINLCVHTVMYGYYFLRAMKVTLPAALPQCITTIQLLQFVVQLLIAAHLAVIKLQAKIPCAVDWHVIWICTAMYLSYFALFAQLFYHAYIVKKKHHSS